MPFKYLDKYLNIYFKNILLERLFLKIGADQSNER